MSSGWRFVGARVEGDDFRIGGVEVWRHRWVPAGLGPVEVVDPQYGQTFHFEVYDIRGAAADVRFAAGEFSNGIWGFYVPPSAGGDEAGG